MSVAKKSLSALGLVILTVMGGSFLAAKLSQKKSQSHKRAKLEQPAAKKPQTSTKKPFFYTSVGSSNPESTQVKATQSVAKFTVNIRTFKSKTEAEKLLTGLVGAGFFGYYTPVRNGDHVLYHVRLGIFSDEREATKTLITLQKKTAFQGSVTQLH